MEHMVVYHDEGDLVAFRGAIPVTFDESVFDGIFDRVEKSHPSDCALGCIFHIFIPPKIVAALAAKYASIVGQDGKIDDGMASATFKEGGR